MTNHNEREAYNSEIRKESYTDGYGNTHTNVTRTGETVNNPNNLQTYRQGYANGRETERHYQQANLAARDNDNASRGLLLGILLTSLVGLIIGAFWYFNQRNEAVINETQPVETPLPANASPSPLPQQTTIIERTTEVPVVIPQPEVSPPSVPSPPQINVTVPPQPPSTSGNRTTPLETPQNSTPRSANPGDSSSNTPAADTKSNSPKTTTPQGADESNSTSSSDSSTAQ